MFKKITPNVELETDTNRNDDIMANGDIYTMSDLNEVKYTIVIIKKKLYILKVLSWNFFDEIIKINFILIYLKFYKFLGKKNFLKSLESKNFRLNIWLSVPQIWILFKFLIKFLE